MIFKPVRTPCVGICSTGIGDEVCRGCKRFSHEVIYWNTYSNDQRRVIADRLAHFLAQVVENYFEIYDQSRLRAQLELQQINFAPEQNPACWVFDLLKAGASQIEDVSEYGLRVRPAHCASSLKALRQAIDQDFYHLSCAHFERYFAAQASFDELLQNSEQKRGANNAQKDNVKK